MNKTIIQIRNTLAAAVVLVSVAAFAAPGDFTNLVAFAGKTTGGQWPMAAPVEWGGTLYGLAQLGGVSNFGVIYRASAAGGNYTNLVSFNGANGAYPVGRLTKNGTNLYGMTARGGTYNNGVIFRVATNGGGYTVLYHFNPTNVNSGAMPWGSVALSGSNLYGMTYYGGKSNVGTIFRIGTNGTGYTNLRSFVGKKNDGEHPKGDLLLDGSTLYGMTSEGGTNDAGVVFRMNVSGGGYTNLYEFKGATDGEGPCGGLMRDGAYLYGLARGGPQKAGIAFSLSTNGGTLNVLHVFDGTRTNGCDPFGTLVKHDTKLYGTTRYGGTNFTGVIFSLGGCYSNLYGFPKSIGEPLSDPVFVGNYLYSSTLKGGVSNKGTLFRYEVATTDTAVAWAAMTWLENGQLATVTAGDYSSDRLWVRHNTGAGLPDYAYVGYGKTQNFDDNTWKWVPMTQYGVIGSDYEFTGTLGRAAAGSYFVAAKFIKGAHVYYTQAGFGAWGDWSTALYATNRWTVNALKAPTNCTATAASSSQINLGWQGDGSHWVIIFRKTTNSFVAPVEGTDYSVGTDYADQGKCIYRGSAAAFNDTGLLPSTTYHYRYYTENYSYYSTGGVAQATTLSGAKALSATRTSTSSRRDAVVAAGISADAGSVAAKALFEDDFNDGNADAWLADTVTAVDWFVSEQGTLTAAGLAEDGYSYCTVKDLDLAGRDVTIEYDVAFGEGAAHGGLVYRGRVLYVNPTELGWADSNPSLRAGVFAADGASHHVVVSVKQGAECPVTALSIDGANVFEGEPIESTSWTSGSFGFLSAYGIGAVEWDNVRVFEVPSGAK